MKPLNTLMIALIALAVTAAGAEISHIRNTHSMEQTAKAPLGDWPPPSCLPTCTGN